VDLFLIILDLFLIYYLPRDGRLLLELLLLLDDEGRE
jgi:hypothetical protein